MLKNIERKILIFTEAYGVEKAEIVHGTLFVKFNRTLIPPGILIQIGCLPVQMD